MRHVKGSLTLFWIILSLCGVGLAVGVASAEDPPASVEERRLRISLEEKYEKLEQEKAAIKEEAAQLKTLRAEVDKRLDELKVLRADVMELLKRQEGVEIKRAAQLAKMYEKMESEKAARLIVGLEESLAVQVLGKMKSKSAGRLLNNLDAETAARLSQVFTSRKFE